MRIINWPCSDLPYRKTLRASAIRCFATQNIGWLAVTLILFIHAMMIVVYHSATLMGYPTVHDVKGSSITVVAYSVSALFLGTAVFMQLRVHVKALSRDFRKGSREAGRLRKEWADFERSSRRFDESYQSQRSGFPKLLDFAATAPNWPLSHYVELDEFKQEVIPTAIPNDRGQSRNYPVALQGLLLSLFSSISRSPQVTGKTPDGLIHLRMVTPTTQFWSFITVLQTHRTLSVQIQTGVLWWTERGRLLDGTPYAGDVQVIRGSLRDFPILRYIPFPIDSLLNTFRTEGMWGFYHLFVLLVPIVPVYVLFGYLTLLILDPPSLIAKHNGCSFVLGIPLAILAIYKAWPGDTVDTGRFESTWDSTAGDLSDLIGISRTRRGSENGFGVVLSSAQKAAIEDARQHVRLCCTKAIDQLTPRTRRDHR